MIWHGSVQSCGSWFIGGPRGYFWGLDDARQPCRAGGQTGYRLRHGLAGCCLTAQAMLLR
ncbi:hypothetical protein [Komagataeibacter rhaeticus]|uniref:hypothetical protein n=1 Tax=Komagataeibacter rhaeticus TaxID=215221 RepID=UPI001427B54A|nr:hypothetical protein [Komagataeibacter rhaeticus]WPP22818.1 hypothetical protein SCD25_04830 [Komagataeibacter rhaeticus]